MSLTLDQLGIRQQELFGRVSRAYDNLLKLGQNNITRQAIENRLDQLRANWNEFLRNHFRILALCTGDTAVIDYFKSDCYGLAEEGYLKSASGMSIELQKLPPDPVPQPSPIAVPVVPRSLPAVPVPTFSGNFCDWLEFKDLFSAIVLRESRISNVEKLQQLKTHVQGEAAEMLRTVQVIDANFEVAWRLLKDHYTNTRCLVAAITRDLLSVPAVTAESAHDLKALLSGTVNALAALKQLKRPTAQWDDRVVALTVRKLDARTFREWESTLSNTTEPPTFVTLKLFIEQRISMLEIVASSIDKHNRKKDKGASSSTFTHTTITEKCRLCQGEHFILRCVEFKAKEPQERKQVVEAKGLCYNCLGAHKLDNCKSLKRCQTCNGKHHSMLHGNLSTATHLATLAWPATLAKGNRLSCNWSASSGNTTLLPTALVKTQGPDGRTHVARAMLDNCSQQFFVAKSLIKKLELTYQATTREITGVGGAKGPQVHGQARLTITSIISEKSTLTFDALILSLISNYRPGVHKLSSDWRYLQGLNLADDFRKSSSKIEILLGADTLPRILQEGLRIGMPGTPMAQ
ncbi:uncharacterized protein LOC111643678 [Copidosoma floridanum]|uniref:uncharacterized protein LOC111643678 n=1 Tax=Copidosoma floridanum TaxID=29053 RepID=UPI000C6F7217|nr:uncharacterized protein LOC111643678 [Copidosoma floridanum]